MLSLAPFLHEETEILESGENWIQQMSLWLQSHFDSCYLSFPLEM